MYTVSAAQEKQIPLSQCNTHWMFLIHEWKTRYFRIYLNKIQTPLKKQKNYSTGLTYMKWA